MTWRRRAALGDRAGLSRCVRHLARRQRRDAADAGRRPVARAQRRRSPSSRTRGCADARLAGRRPPALARSRCSSTALRSARNWGIGDFTDLTGPDRALPQRTARPASGLTRCTRCFRIGRSRRAPMRRTAGCSSIRSTSMSTAIPEFAGSTRRRRDRAHCAAPNWSTIAGVARAKLTALRVAYERFRQRRRRARRADFEAFRAEQGEALLRFACFEVLRTAVTPTPWPDGRRRGAPRRATISNAFAARIADACEFQEFLQWTADRQLRRMPGARRRLGHAGRSLHRCRRRHRSARRRRLERSRTRCCRRFSVGAPPDEFNPAGQDWGLAPFNPRRRRDDDFAPMRQLLRAPCAMPAPSGSIMCSA